MKKYPLKFLDSYTKADTEIFFGREEEVNALYEMIFQTDILLIYGASGTGKTSLIQCGLASKFESHDWLDIYVRRGSNINTSLENALKKISADFNEEDLDWLDDINLEEEATASIAVDTKAMDTLEKQFKNIYQNAFRPIYLIFDQFEELYILGTEDEQQIFVNNVKKILQLDQPVKMIFSIREEYLGFLYEFERDVPQFLKKKLRVEPMTLTKVQSVIKGVTTFEDSTIDIKDGELAPFTEAVFERLQGRDGDGQHKKSLTIELPYLQVFLDKLYVEITKDRQRQTEATFSLAALHQIGVIDDVLREFLEEQVQMISQRLRATYAPLNAEHIWKILSPFVTLDGTKEPIPQSVITNKIKSIFIEEQERNQKLSLGTEAEDSENASQERVAITELTNEQNEALTQAFIEAFIKSKIIRYLENDEVYEIAHDALAAKIAEKRSDDEIALLEVKRLIKSQAALKEDAREPFTQRQMDFIAPYLYQLELDDKELQLLEDSHQKIKAEQEAEKARQQAELKATQEQAKKDRILRKQAENATQKATRFSRIAIIVAVAAVLAAVFAYRFYTEAKQREEETIAALEKVKVEKRKAEVSDSLAQIDKKNALMAKAEAEEKDSIAQVKAGEASAAERKARASERKAKLALNEIAKREVKSGSTAVEQFQWEKAMEHLKSANQSEEDTVKTQVKNTLINFVIIGIYRLPPEKWQTDLQPLFAAFQQTTKGIEVNFEDKKRKAILLEDFEKARQKALKGNKLEARRELIRAMQKVLGNELVKSVETVQKSVSN